MYCQGILSQAVCMLQLPVASYVYNIGHNMYVASICVLLVTLSFFLADLI